MRKFLHVMKGNYRGVVLVLLILLFQTVCALTLPLGTARMIDIGIGQGGITSVLYDTISEEGMEHLLLLMTGEERAAVLEGYELSGDCYVKKTMDPETEAHILSVMTAPMVAVYALETDGADYEEVLGDLYVPRGLDAFGILSALPEEARLSLTEAAREQIRQIPSNLIRQAAVNFVRSDLEVQGIDGEKLQQDYLAGQAVIMALAVVGMFLCELLVLLLSGRIAADCGKRLRDRLVGHIVSMGLEEYDNLDQDPASVVTEDVWQIQTFLKDTLQTALYAPILGIGAVAAAFTMNSGMGWVLLLAFLLAAFLAVAVPAACRADGGRLHRLTGRLYEITSEWVSGVWTIRAFDNSALEKRRFEEVNRAAKKVRARQGRIWAVMMPSMLLIVNGVTLLVVWQGAHAINEGNLMVGGLTAFIQYLLLVILGFLAMSSSLAGAAGTKAAVESVERIFEAGRPEEQERGEQAKRESEVEHLEWKEERPALELRHAAFIYRNTFAPVLEELSFAVFYGKITAVTGETGFGKSTLLRLAAGLYPATNGEILVDGRPLAVWPQEALRAKIGYVSQNPVLFSGTVASNLRFGKADATEQEMWRALEIAGAAEFVAKRREGLESEIAPGGSNLSGGQKQRLALAAVVIRKPEIYLLDDCFSALDQETAGQVWTELKRAAGDSAILLADQRIDRIQEADQILVLDRGRIVGKGCHGELLAECAVYRELVQSQRESADEGKAAGEQITTGYQTSEATWENRNIRMTADTWKYTNVQMTTTDREPGEHPTKEDNRKAVREQTTTNDQESTAGLRKAGDRKYRMLPTGTAHGTSAVTRGTVQKRVSFGTYRFPMTFVILCGLLAAACTVTGPWVLGSVTTEIFNGIMAKLGGTGGMDYGRVLSRLSTLLVLYLAGTGFTLCQGWLMAGISSRLNYDLRKQAAEKLHSLSVAYYETHGQGEVLARVNGDIEKISAGLGEGVGQLVTAISTVTGICVMMFLIHPLLLAAALLLLAASGGFLAGAGRLSGGVLRRQQSALDRLRAGIEESSRGFSVIKTMGRESETRRELQAAGEAFRQVSGRAAFAAGLPVPVLSFLGNVGYLLLALGGGYLALQGQMSIGGIQAMIHYIRSFSQPLGQISRGWVELQQARQAKMRVTEFLEAEEEPDPAEEPDTKADLNPAEKPDAKAEMNPTEKQDAKTDQNSVEEPCIAKKPDVVEDREEIRKQNLKSGSGREWKKNPGKSQNGRFETAPGSVIFDHVSFHYDRDSQVLEDFTFEARPGQKVAVVGSTGAGKTTLVKLMMRFYDVEKGRILVDGVDVRQFDRGMLRRRFGVVLQEVWLFHGTILENIRYGRPEAADQEVYRAAAAAHADNFIRQLSQGYETVIDGAHCPLSRGQQQLLAIARAFLADPEILILDEATSSVDTRTEALIRKAMEELMTEKTCFLIAHRSSTIRSVDTVLRIL